MHESERPIRVFIGSSSEGREIAVNLQDQLESRTGCEVDLWEHVFEPSGYALPSLLSAAALVDFAVLVATGDDTTMSRGKEQESVRDNIILEFGLFAGVLGLARTYLLATGSDLKLPSDVFGLTRLQYKQRSDNQVAPALNSAVISIKRQIDALGPRARPEAFGAQQDSERLRDADRSASVADGDTAVPGDVAPTSDAINSTNQDLKTVVSEADIHEVEELVTAKRRSYGSASAFYRNFVKGKWLKDFELPPKFSSAVVRQALKDKWLEDADFTRSWDHSNIVLMRLELVADLLTGADLDLLLELPTKDEHGNDQQAGMVYFLEFMEDRHSAALSERAKASLIDLKAE